MAYGREVKPRRHQSLRKAVITSTPIGPKSDYSSSSCLTVASPKVILMLCIFLCICSTTPQDELFWLEVFSDSTYPPCGASKARGTNPESWRPQRQKKVHWTELVPAISQPKSRPSIKWVNMEDRQALSSHGHLMTSICTLQQRKRSTPLPAKLRLFWS